ncbi:MAG: anion permease [Haloarculaceae archaeon]
MAGAGLATLLIAVVASAFMAWSIGAGSSGSTPFAPAVGANAIPVMRAGFVVGLLGLAGAVLQGANISEAVGRELIRNVTLSPIAATVALLTAAGLVAFGVYTGYPIATAFTVTGAVVGTGLALGGAPAWAKYREIVTLWTSVPFVGGGVAYATARLLIRADRDRLITPFLGALVGLILANVRFVLLGPAGVGRSMAQIIGRSLPLGSTAATALVSVAIAVLIGIVLERDVARDPARGQQHFLLALGALVAFSAGGSQVGLAVGPLLPLSAVDAIPLPYVLFGGGLGLLVGSWTGAPRMIKALSQDYSSLGPRRSIAALIPSFAIAQTAVFFGIPVSFNEIIVSAIVGAGYAGASGGGGGVSRAKMGYTVLAWVGSLLLAIGVGFAAYTAVNALGLA